MAIFARCLLLLSKCKAVPKLIMSLKDDKGSFKKVTILQCMIQYFKVGTLGELRPAGAICRAATGFPVLPSTFGEEVHFGEDSNPFRSPLTPAFGPLL
jgi:hypothetical protein